MLKPLDSMSTLGQKEVVGEGVSDDKMMAKYFAEALGQQPNSQK